MPINFSSFIHYTRNERIGIVVLSSALISLIAVRATMGLWVKPDIDTEKEKQLIEKWASYQQTQQPAPIAKVERPAYEKENSNYTTPLPHKLNINTADTATLIRIKGVGKVTAEKIIYRRNKKGAFTNIAQLHEVGSFSEEHLTMLSTHIIFTDSLTSE
jgi:competence protein ComEA